MFHDRLPGSAGAVESARSPPTIMAGLASRFNRRLGVFSNFGRICADLRNLASGAAKERKTFTLAERTTSGTNLQQHVNRIAQNLPGVSIPSKETDLQGEDQ